MSRNTQPLACTMLFGLGLYAALLSLGVYANPEEELNSTLAHPSIEILTLSRGRGVPETTFKVFQEIMAVANTALESGTAVSVKQEKIGLEGETRLCIVFRDKQAFTAIGNQIRSLATNTELLQVKHNHCSAD